MSSSSAGPAPSPAAPPEASTYAASAHGRDPRQGLKAQLEQSQSAAVADAAEVTRLGRRFLRQGILERRLLPWLWRNLQPPVADDQVQIAFLLGRRVQLGLLTRLPGDIEPPQWILPMRLPDRRAVLAAADARKQFASFLEEMEAGAAAPEAAGTEREATTVEASNHQPARRRLPAADPHLTTPLTPFTPSTPSTINDHRCDGKARRKLPLCLPARESAEA